MNERQSIFECNEYSQKRKRRLFRFSHSSCTCCLLHGFTAAFKVHIDTSYVFTNITLRSTFTTSVMCEQISFKLPCLFTWNIYLVVIQKFTFTTSI